VARPAAGIPKVDPLKVKGRLAELATKVALTKPGTWFYSRVAARIDGPLVRATGGRISSVAGLFPVVLLTARGAKSGIERTVPLVYFSDGDDVILMASSFGRPRYPAWYRNVKVNPDVRLESMGGSGSYVVTETEGEERDRLYALAKSVYRGYGIYEQRTAGIRHVPVLRLTSRRSPEDAASRSAGGL
jgi:deazaflavin-dependent oxidoreductase (nitroreductase family)